MENILETHYRRKPKHFWQRREPVTPLELAVTSLQDCQAELLENLGKSEYYSAMSKMLSDREKRLQNDVFRLTQESSNGKTQVSQS